MSEITPNKLTSKEVKAIIKEGYEIPTTIKDSDKMFYVVLALSTTANNMGTVTKSVKVITKDPLGWGNEKNKGGLTALYGCQKIVILHDPTVKAKAPAKEVEKETVVK